MRVLLLADTHVPGRARDLPAAVWQAASTADAVLHAGDLTDLWLLHALRRFAPTHAVAGNVDPPDTAAALPDHAVVELGGRRVGLTHGHLGSGRTTPQRALAAFTGRAVDVVVFGHSHQPLVEQQGGVLLVNPGSPTDRRRAPRHTYGWLYLDDGGPRAEIVPV